MPIYHVTFRRALDPVRLEDVYKLEIEAADTDQLYTALTEDMGQIIAETESATSYTLTESGATVVTGKSEQDVIEVADAWVEDIRYREDSEPSDASHDLIGESESAAYRE